MTAFLVIVASILFFFALLRFDQIAAGFSQAWNILTPIITGLVIAFLAFAIVNFVVSALPSSNDNAHGGGTSALIDITNS